MRDSRRFITEALMYDTVRSELVGSITAQKANPEDFPPENFEYYCRDCFEGHNHFTRLVRVKEQRDRAWLPAKFHLYGKADSTHICDHPARTRDLDELAERYGAIGHGSHSYSFVMNIPGTHCEDRPWRNAAESVDKATRLAKITYELLFDNPVMQKQALRIHGQDVPFSQAMYDEEAKVRLYEESLAAAQEGRTLYAATLFRPIGNRGEWQKFNGSHIIPGMAGPRITYSGEKLQPSALLLCRTRAVYESVREMANREGGRRSSALLVFARAALNIDRLEERVERLKQGSVEQRAAYTNFVIESDLQVTPWDHPTSFDAALKGQSKGPYLPPQKSLALG